MNRVRRLLEIDRLQKMGVQGEGITVAVLDSGIEAHPDFSNRILMFKDFVNRKNIIYDDEGHGTHVAGIIASDGGFYGGKYKGIAPKANLVSLKVLNQKGIGKEEDVIEAVRWIIDNGKKYGIRVVNISFGAIRREREDNIRLLKAVELLWDLGYVVVASAGNNGPAVNSILTPGDSKKIITVGAANDNVRMTVGGREKIHYSGRGPTIECIQKPDLVAPANRIYSCCHLWRQHYYYISKSGTSMATPIVTGIVALLLSKNPGLSNLACKRLLKETATDLNLEGNRQGWGMVNPTKALNNIRK